MMNYRNVGILQSRIHSWSLVFMGSFADLINHGLQILRKKTVSVLNVLQAFLSSLYSLNNTL
jgi:hypothetical protein